MVRFAVRALLLEKVQPVGASDELFMIPSEVDMAAIEIELVQRENYSDTAARGARSAA